MKRIALSLVLLSSMAASVFAGSDKIETFNILAGNASFGQEVAVSDLQNAYNALSKEDKAFGSVQNNVSFLKEDKSIDLEQSFFSRYKKPIIGAVATASIVGGLVWLYKSEKGNAVLDASTTRASQAFGSVSNAGSDAAQSMYNSNLVQSALGSMTSMFGKASGALSGLKGYFAPAIKEQSVDQPVENQEVSEVVDAVDSSQDLSENETDALLSHG
jgi:hypothetical protein